MSSITGMFVGLHVLLATQLNQPAIAISEEEGKEFMGRVQNVMRHYSVQTTQKTLDWIALAGCTSGMYIPRIAAVAITRKGRERAEAAPPRRPGPSAPQQVQPTTQLQIVPDSFSTSGFQDTGG